MHYASALNGRIPSNHAHFCVSLKQKDCNSAVTGDKPMDRSKIVAVITGAIALLLGIAYLAIVQFLDFRGEMVPAPIDLSHVMMRIIIG